MLKDNRRHFSRVALYGGCLIAAVCAAGYFLLGGRFAGGAFIGGALSALNIYSIIMLTETVAGVALGEGPSPAAKTFSVVMQLLKMFLIVGVIVLLLITGLGDPYGILAGFTVVLLVHVAVGLMKAREILVEENMDTEEEEQDA